MGFLKKLFSYSMTGDYEQVKRIELYEKLGKKVGEMSTKELKQKLKELEEWKPQNLNQKI